MKRMLVAALCVLMLLSLFGCSKKEDHVPDETNLMEETQSVATEPVTELTNPIDPVIDTTLSTEDAQQIILNDPETFVVSPDDAEDIPNIEDLTVPEGLPSEREDEQTEEVWSSTQPTDADHQEPRDNVINILLIGEDSDSKEDSGRSDAMILATFNRSKKTVTLISFMRDAYVSIPGYKSNKLNAAYGFGGMDLLNRTLEQNYGVQIDGNVKVDFSSFRELIDLLGGVDITLTGKEADYLNRTYNWQLSEGSQLLTGEQALAYSRIRKIDSDYRRTERQRKLLLSLLRRYQSQPLTKMLVMVDDILPLVETNMSKLELVSYIGELMPLISKTDINTLQIPADGTFRQGTVCVRDGLTGWFQYDIDFEANCRLLNEIFAE